MGDIAAGVFDTCHVTISVSILLSPPYFETRDFGGFYCLIHAPTSLLQLAAVSRGSANSVNFAVFLPNLLSCETLLYFTFGNLLLTKVYNTGTYSSDMAVVSERRVDLLRDRRPTFVCRRLSSVHCHGASTYCDRAIACCFHGKSFTRQGLYI